MLRPEQFEAYPPHARQLATANIALLQRMPQIFAAILLRELIDYDWKFPAERTEIERQLQYLGSLPEEDLRKLLQGFEEIRVGAEIERLNWVQDPASFSERLTAYLWSTHQIDAFRAAAMSYTASLRTAVPAEVPSVSRLGIAVIGKGVSSPDRPLFRKLRPHGVFFSQVDPRNGLQLLVEAVSARASTNALPYGHWYIDGSMSAANPPQVTSVSYDAMSPVREALLKKMQQVIRSGSGGPELLQTTLAHIGPAELGMQRVGDSVLDHFRVNLLTQGSGTQIFSTTFVQWAAREALRRAQPLTLMARFTPRQKLRPMNELIEDRPASVELDPAGSLVDADMGSYYIWLDLQRLANRTTPSFLVWFEDQNQALGIGPSLPGGTQSDNPATMAQLLSWIA